MDSKSLVPPVLNPSSLYKEEAKRDATRIRIYNNVLEKIYKRVKAIARIPGNEKSIVFVVPEFIPGSPLFDISEAILYIVWNLRNAGYTVSYTHPNLLYISWKSHDEHYKTVESPWIQVLNTARTAVLTSSEPSVISSVIKPQPVSSVPEIIKRKTPLKKTVEFKPEPDIIPKSPFAQNPSVLSAMYAGAGSATPTPSSSSRLPGQLSDKHISFV